MQRQPNPTFYLLAEVEVEAINFTAGKLALTTDKAFLFFAEVAASSPAFRNF